MKILSKVLALGLALSLFSCASDEPVIDNGPQNKPGTETTQDGFYSLVRFSFPKTRSTQSEGEEIGKDYENKVGSILVVMSTKDETSGDYKFLSYALNDASINTSSADNKYTITFQDKEKLFEQAGNTVYIFAYCNPTEEIRNTITTLNVGDSFTDAICKTNVEGTWADNGFLMTSVKIENKELPNKETLKTYNTPTNAFNLGTIEVIRTMSRFDFRDASPETTAPLTYEIKNEATGDVQGSVKFTRVALFNLADKFYYLPRTKANDATDITLCPTYAGMESGFVVSPSDVEYTYKRPATINPLDPAASGLKWDNLTTILIGTEDNDNNWNTEDPAKFPKDYRIWRYATENTFAQGASVDADKITGYVFEAEIEVADDFGNVVDGKAGEMYLYGNVLYANATKLYENVANYPVSTLATAFNACFNVTKDDAGNVTAITKKTDADLAAHGFTTYVPNDDGKYFCYYFAYNVHNDDEDITSVGDMEFATVRNNVYKLAITTVKRFGGFTPPKPDEWDVYFDLNVQVKPWVVRVNNIEF